MVRFLINSDRLGSVLASAAWTLRPVEQALRSQAQVGELGHPDASGRTTIQVSMGSATCGTHGLTKGALFGIRPQPFEFGDGHRSIHLADLSGVHPGVVSH